jgi:hypothetical protein
MDNKILREVYVSMFHDTHLEEIRDTAGIITGYARVEDEPVQVKLELTIDLPGIVQILGDAACRNKSGRAIGMGGFIRVEKIS